MSPALESLVSCFQGLIPATLHTCSSDGIPNVAYLSHVDYVDPAHVALSFQFFNKSRRNITENPRAMVSVIDPDTLQGWRLALRYERSDTAGAIFDRMALRIDAIASYAGLKGIFKLLAADIYEVLAIEPCAVEAGVETMACSPAAAEPVFTVKALQLFADRIHRAGSLETLLDSSLGALEEAFGFGHAMILLPGEREGTFVTIASRGYADNGAGAEVRYGEGLIGMVAEARKPIRISGLLREMLYAQAVHASVRDARGCSDTRRISLPGLPNPSSQLGIPLLVRGELMGVLCIESDVPYRFHERDRIQVELLGGFLAMAIQNLLLQERADARAELTPPAAGEANGVGRAIDRTEPRVEVTFHAAEECILVNGEYLIRSLPARILWKLLSIARNEQRHTFTNRELRLDRSLNLPEYKDNLESRLLLLRRRLEQKCPAIRLVPSARGRFTLALSGDVVLTEKR